MDKGTVFITDNLIYTASRLPTYHSQGVIRTWNEKKHEKSKACAIKVRQQHTLYEGMVIKDGCGNIHFGPKKCTFFVLIFFPLCPSKPVCWLLRLL